MNELLHRMKPKFHLIEDIFSSSFIFYLTFGIIIPCLVNKKTHGDSQKLSFSGLKKNQTKTKGRTFPHKQNN